MTWKWQGLGHWSTDPLILIHWFRGEEMTWKWRKWQGNDVEMTRPRPLIHWSIDPDPPIFKAVNVLGGEYGKYGEQYWFKWHWIFWQGARHFYNLGVQYFYGDKYLTNLLDKYFFGDTNGRTDTKSTNTNSTNTNSRTYTTTKTYTTTTTIVGIRGKIQRYKYT